MEAKDESYNAIEERRTSEKMEMVPRRSSRKTTAPKENLTEGGDLVEFISSTFKKRECCVFVASKKDPELCGCGRPKHVHTRISEDGSTWNKDTHTIASPTDAFGEIKFLGFGQENTIFKPYVRLDEKTKYEDVWTLLKDYWLIEPPTLIISVTGGNKSFHLSRKMEHAFKHGLVNAAASTGAWITSTGHNAGVAKVVGEAVRYYSTANMANKQITCIGFLSWGYVDNKEALVNEQGTGSFPAIYNHEDCQAKTDLKREAPLQPNHTHFIFIDDGVDKIYGGAGFRAGMEMYISQTVSSSGDKCPVVRLVLEGGLNTLDGAAEAIKNDIPCVFFKGTGRTACFIAHAYKVTMAYSSDEVTIFPENFNELISKETAHFLKQCKSDRSPETVYANVRTVLSKRLLVNVFDFTSGDSADVEFAILNALLKAHRSDVDTQTCLALAWNRCDLAREHIFATEKRLQWLAIPLHDHLTKALVQNKVDFVQLFLDKGVELKTFLTDKKLAEIWAKSLDVPGCPAATMIKTALLEVFPMDDDGGLHEKIQTRLLLREIGEMLVKNIGFHCLNPYGDGPIDVFEKDYSKDGLRLCIDPEKEMFMWAVSLNREDLACLFWQTGNDHIALALAGSSVLRSVSKAADVLDMTDESAALSEHASALENKATGVLNECNIQSQLNTRETLVRTLPEYGHNVTAMSIANIGEHMVFMESSSCQAFLSRVWKGRLATYTETWRILLAAVFPFLILSMRFRRKNVHPGRKATPRPKNSEEGVYSPLTRDSPVGILRAFYYYYTSPVVKFIYYTASMLILFGLLGYFVMIDLRPWWSPENHFYAHAREIVIWVWMVTLLAEEVRQIIGNQSQSFRNKIIDWINDFWNQLDVLIFSLLIVSVILRFTLTGDAFFYARVTYVMCLATMLIRFTNHLYVHPDLGPKVIMIGRMLNDLLFFIALVVIFIISYGIASQALLFPNAIPQIKMLKHIFYYPYWAMNGEFDLDLAEGTLADGTPCSSNRTQLMNNPGLEQCPTATWVVPLAFCLYVLLVNVLLLNLLIAIFSYTFQQIQEQSNRVWRYTLYSFYEENYNRPPFPPPLVILSHIFHLFQGIYLRCKGIRRTTAFYVHVGDDDTTRLRTFERYAVNMFIFKVGKDKDESIESQMESAGEKISQVASDMDQFKDDMESKSHARDVDTVGTLQATVNELRTEVSAQRVHIDQQTQLLRDILSRLNSGVDPTSRRK